MKADKGQLPRVHKPHSQLVPASQLIPKGSGRVGPARARARAVATCALCAAIAVALSVALFVVTRSRAADLAAAREAGERSGNPAGSRREGDAAASAVGLSQETQEIGQAAAQKKAAMLEKLFALPHFWAAQKGRPHEGSPGVQAQGGLGDKQGTG